MKAMSLFAGGGIGETYLDEIDIDVRIANEVIPNRASIYKYRFPKTKMIVGDIRELEDVLINKGKEEEVELLIATPPCQGMSVLGKKDYDGDERNFLITNVFHIIDALDFNYIFIENVPKFLKMYYFRKDVELDGNGDDKIILTDILKEKYGEKYNILYNVYDAADYGVPQRRKRAIIRMFKKNFLWNEPDKCKKQITLREAIGHLPSIEVGETCNNYRYHVAPSMNSKHIEMMKHTPSGCSAYDNKIYYPKVQNLEKRQEHSEKSKKRHEGKPIDMIHGFHNTYTRLDWDKVCPTRTMKSSNISGSNNGHPGRCIVDGDEEHRIYSDARTLTLLELMLVTSLPEDMDLPENINENLIRDIIGEGVPPRMSEAFLAMLQN